MFYENYLTSDFHTNTVNSRRVCPLVKMASKTVIGRIRTIKNGIVSKISNTRKSVFSYFQNQEVV